MIILKLLIFLIILTSTLNVQSTTNDQLSVRVFPIADIYNNSPHCTGFYVEEYNTAYTAAHCFHNLPLQVFNNNEKLNLIFQAEQIKYTESKYGLLDIIAITDLTNEQTQTLKNVNKINTANNSLTSTAFGYPSILTKHEITQLFCTPLNNENTVNKIESQLGIVSFDCINSNKESINEHRQIKGASGGPAFIDNQLAVLFHFGINSYLGRETLKTIYLSEITNLLSVKTAQRKYLLKRKSIEQVKIPNTIIIELDEFLQKHSPYKRNFAAFLLHVDINQNDVTFKFEKNSFTTKDHHLDEDLKLLFNSIK